MEGAKMFKRILVAVILCAVVGCGDEEEEKVNGEAATAIGKYVDVGSKMSLTLNPDSSFILSSNQGSDFTTNGYSYTGSYKFDEYPDLILLTFSSAKKDGSQANDVFCVGKEFTGHIERIWDGRIKISISSLPLTTRYKKPNYNLKLYQSK